MLSSLLFVTGLLLAGSDLPSGVPQTTSLQSDAEISRRTHRPILLMISQDHCPFCDLMKREVLQPMLLGGEYAELIIIREILIDRGLEIIDFQGATQDAAAFAQGYGVHLTPTLLFLDPQGNELVKRIVGINTVDYFSFYLEAAIDEATEQMSTSSRP
ncbi:MAG: thioredoxin fold domain-containing protein [Gammaproteobacteria bacterium]|nr:thioredoxin fold domain-containing protein [Gammaproteobacteria bacterium]